jgi:hypothetical protein
MEIRHLEDFLSHQIGFDDKAVALAVGSYVGGQEILANKRFIGYSQEIKADGSTVGKLDNISGKKISEYINSRDISKKVRFNSEEKMPFNKPKFGWKYAGIFDDLDGSINPMIGGANLNYVGTGGVIHDEFEQQVFAAAYLPFLNKEEIFVAEKGKGTYVITFSRDKMKENKIKLSLEPAQRNSLIESGWTTPNTLDAEQSLRNNGFYDLIGNAFAKDRVTGGIFQTVSGLKDSRQIVLNFAASHQADYCYLLLEEAGAEVIGQYGHPMDSTSNAMLSIAPSFTGDRKELKEKFRSSMMFLNEGGYRGWNPEAPLERVTG